MQTEQARSAFLSLRANGWSLRSIASRLGISKSTLFNWERQPETRRLINTLKCIQIENIQEKFIPSFEDELQELSSLLSRVESALNVHSFYDMRPEFLLRMSVQLRTRLQKLRCDVHPVHTYHDDPEIPTSPRPGCISRSDDLALPPKPANGVPSPQGRGQGEGEEVDQLANAEFLEPRLNGQVLQSELLNGTKLDKNENLSQHDSSAPTTSISQNGTLVPKPLTPAPTHSLTLPAQAIAHDRALTAILEALRSLQLGLNSTAPHSLASNGDRPH